MGTALPVGREILIPDQLSVAIYEGGIRTARGMLPVLFYATQGMERHGQREMVFAVVRTASPAPAYPLLMARTVYRLATEGRLVDAGDVSVLGEPGIDADERVTAFVYGKAPDDLPSTVDFPRPPLIALPLLAGESAVVQRFGHARVLALMGAQERYYPFPWWFRPGREPVVDDVEYRAATLLSQAPAYNVPFLHVVQSGDRLEISVAVDELPAFQEAMREAPDVCAFLPGMADVPKTYVWAPGQQGPAAIVAAGGADVPEISCNFLLVVRGNVEPTARQLEDGFAVLLTGAMHARLLQAVEAGKPVEIGLPSGVVETVALRLRERSYESPFGQVHRTDGEFTLYRPLPGTPEPALDQPHLRLIDRGRIVLLTGEEDLRRAVTAEQLGDFVDRARVVVDRLFAGVRHGTEELLIEFRLAPVRPVVVRVMARPEAPPREVQVVLERQLQALDPPRVRYTEIRFQLHLTFLK